jgi:hypothetical protein
LRRYQGTASRIVEATFERLKAIFGLDLEPSVALLRQLQTGEVDLGGIEQAVSKVVDPDLLDYNDTWDKGDDMLESCMSRAFGEQTSIPRVTAGSTTGFSVETLSALQPTTPTGRRRS